MSKQIIRKFLLENTYSNRPIMSIIKASRNQDQLLFDGFVYRRAKPSLSAWRCGRNDCPGRVRSDETKYIVVTHHNHAPDRDQMIANEFKSKITHHAVISHDPPRRIIHEALLTIEQDDEAAVPSYSSSQRTIQRKRKKNDIPLPTPSSFDDIAIPAEFTVTNSGARFLLYNNGDNSKRMLIFSSDDDLDRLANSDSIGKNITSQLFSS